MLFKKSVGWFKFLLFCADYFFSLLICLLSQLSMYSILCFLLQEKELHADVAQQQFDAAEANLVAAAQQHQQEVAHLTTQLQVGSNHAC